MVVPVAVVAHAGGLEEGVCLVGCALAGLNAVGTYEGLADDGVHIVRQTDSHAAGDQVVAHFWEAHLGRRAHVQVHA